MLSKITHGRGCHLESGCGFSRGQTHVEGESECDGQTEERRHKTIFHQERNHAEKIVGIPKPESTHLMDFQGTTLGYEFKLANWHSFGSALTILSFY
jgi:hypothetical protein